MDVNKLFLRLVNNDFMLIGDGSSSQIWSSYGYDTLTLLYDTLPQNLAPASIDVTLLLM
jgi:hypothetical protein